MLAVSPLTAHPFTIVREKGLLTASWKGEAGEISADAPTDEDLAALAAIPDLEKISISGCTPLRGTGFAALTNLSKLAVISFNGSGSERFSQLFGGDLDGFAALARLVQMREVSCGHVRIPVKGAVMLLSGMTSLETFNPGTYADDAILAAAAQAPNLKVLGFGHWDTIPDAKVTMAGVAHYAKMARLESVSPGQLRPADGSVAEWIGAVMSAPALTSARIQMNAKTDVAQRGHPKELFPAKNEDFAAVAKAKGLERVILQGVEASEGSLTGMSGLGNLKLLRFENSSIPKTEIDALKAGSPDTLQIIVAQ